MILFAVSAVSSHPDWHLVAKGILPTLPTTNKKDLLLYAYFVVGIFSALLMEYEVHFYSSGAIEEGWKTKDLGENFMVAALGSLLGSLLTIALIILGAIVFVSRQIFPETLSSTVLAGALPFGPMALRLLLGGVLAALGGAVVETALSGSYNLCQFFNFRWGKDMRARQTPVYTSAWVAMLALGLLIAITGIRPLQLVNISVIFGMVIMPFTYYPILLTAADRKVMGKHANKRIVSYVAGFFFVLIVIAALAAVPLSIVTNWGRP
jgi:Mn2+/Fe2+ NRAMP family transporter